MSVVLGVAGTRSDKIGTIFSRVSGLIRSGAISGASVPLWYPIYQAFPPKYEPRFDRPAPKIKISSIVYQEDTPRAELHRSRQTRPFDLTTSGPIDEKYFFRARMYPFPATRYSRKETDSVF